MRNMEHWRAVGAFMLWTLLVQLGCAGWVVAFEGGKLSRIGVHSLVLAANNTGILAPVVLEAAVGPQAAAVGMLATIALYFQQLPAAQVLFELDAAERERGRLRERQWVSERGSKDPKSMGAAELEKSMEAAAAWDGDMGSSGWLGLGMGKGQMGERAALGGLAAQAEALAMWAGAPAGGLGGGRALCAGGAQRQPGQQEGQLCHVGGHHGPEEEVLQWQRSWTLTSPGNDRHRQPQHQPQHQPSPHSQHHRDARHLQQESAADGNGLQGSFSMALEGAAEGGAPAGGGAAGGRTQLARRRTFPAELDAAGGPASPARHDPDAASRSPARAGDGPSARPCASPPLAEARSPARPADFALLSHHTGTAASAARPLASQASLTRRQDSAGGAPASHDPSPTSAFASHIPIMGPCSPDSQTHHVYPTLSLQPAPSPVYGTTHIAAVPDHAHAATAMQPQPGLRHALSLVAGNALMWTTGAATAVSMLGLHSLLDPDQPGHIPELNFIEGTLSWLARCSVPVSLFAMGLWSHGRGGWLGLSWRTTMSYLALKMLVLPLVMVFVNSLLGLSGRLARSLVVLTCVPVGQMAFVISEQYGEGAEAVTGVMQLGLLLMLPHVVGVMASLRWLGLYE